MKHILLLCLLMVTGQIFYAQVTITPTLSSARATLEVTGEPNNTDIPDGILPPRLTREQLIAKTSYGLEHIGAVVYVTDLSGTVFGSTANVNATGLYYFNGTSWKYIETYYRDGNDLSSTNNELTSKVRGISSSTDIVTVLGNTTSSNTLKTAVNSVNSSGTPIIHSNALTVTNSSLQSTVNGITSNSIAVPNIYTGNRSLSGNRTVTLGNHTLAFTSSSSYGSNQFSVDGSTFSVNAQSNKVGFGVINPVAKLDVRSSAGNTTNPGTGYLGIGTVDSEASEAGAGAIRYTTLSGGTLQFSDGQNWKYLESSVEKSIVIAKKTTPQTISMTVDPVLITGWSEITDVNGDFNPVTGEFTAPRDGNYIISFGYSFNYASIDAGTQVEAILFSPLGTPYFKKSVISFPRSGNSQAGASITFGVRMNAGEVYRPSVWHDTGSDKTLRVGNGNSDGYVNFSVREL